MSLPTVNLRINGWDKSNFPLNIFLLFIFCQELLIFLCIIGEEVEVKRLSVRGLLPETDYYMTYDGSTTMPACHETVTWLILNKPIYITKQQVLYYFSSPLCLYIHAWVFIPLYKTTTCMTFNYTHTILITVTHNYRRFTN